MGAGVGSGSLSFVKTLHLPVNPTGIGKKEQAVNLGPEETLQAVFLILNQFPLPPGPEFLARIF